jgi:hypothetical protein
MQLQLCFHGTEAMHADFYDSSWLMCVAPAAQQAHLSAAAPELYNAANCMLLLSLHTASSHHTRRPYSLTPDVT